MSNYPTYSKINNFTDIKARQIGHELVLLVYSCLKTFPNNEQYALADQMRRAVVSVVANIAEGSGRYTYKEKYRFYTISRGSLIELKNHLIIARDLLYITRDKYEILISTADRTHMLLNGLLRKTQELQ